MRKILLYIVLCLCSVYFAEAQIQPSFTQFMFNPLVYNAAYSGVQEDIVAVAQSRLQWVNTESIQAPRTYAFSAHGLMNNEINGLGLTLMHDDNALMKYSDINASFSHRLIFKKSTLSLGLSGGVQNYQSNFGDVLLKNSDDFAFENNQNVASISPKFGAGLFYYSTNYYMGLSMPQITSSKISDSNTIDAKTMFFNAGYVLTLGESAKVKPNMQVKYAQGAPLQVDLNANILVFDVLWFGFSYRSLESLDLLLEIHFSNKMRMGYSYDLGLNGFRTHNKGSHEFMLSYKFMPSENSLEKRSYSPRYF